MPRPPNVRSRRGCRQRRAFVALDDDADRPDRKIETVFLDSPSLRRDGSFQRFSTDANDTGFRFGYPSNFLFFNSLGAECDGFMHCRPFRCRRCSTGRSLRRSTGRGPFLYLAQQNGLHLNRFFNSPRDDLGRLGKILFSLRWGVAGIGSAWNRGLLCGLLGFGRRFDHNRLLNVRRRESVVRRNRTLIGR